MRAPLELLGIQINGIFFQYQEAPLLVQWPINHLHSLWVANFAFPTPGEGGHPQEREESIIIIGEDLNSGCKSLEIDGKSINAIQRTRHWTSIS